MTDLVIAWTVIIAFAVFMYVLLDGFDLGIGILFPFAPGNKVQDAMIAAVAPIWDGNETWLVMGGIGLYAAFPLAFAVLLPALYVPITLMVLGLVFRGVAFEFRPMHRAGKDRFWGWAFFAGSLVATFAQGCVLGRFVLGVPITGRSFAGGPWDWVHPFVLATGLGLVSGYVLLGATWLVMKTEGESAKWARQMSVRSVWGVLAFIGMVSIATPWLDARIASRWFSWPHIVWMAPIPIATGLVALILLRSLAGHADRTPFLWSICLFVLCYAGLAISLFPYVVPPSLTLQQAANDPSALRFLLAGALPLLPVILAYTTWSYWVFRGKVDSAGSYH